RRTSRPSRRRSTRSSPRPGVRRASPVWRCERLKLGELRVALVDALAGPDLRQRHEPLAEPSPLEGIVRNAVRGDGDAHLVKDDLRLLCHLVTLLAHDRDLAGLRYEELAQLLELGGGGVTAGEDAE